MEARTTREFSYKEDIWPVVEKWAGQNSHREISRGPNSRLYKRGFGFWTAPTMLEATQEGSTVRLQVWVKAGVFARLLTLFILPAEMGVESGGFKGVAPRSIARKAANILLKELSQAPIG